MIIIGAKGFAKELLEVLKERPADVFKDICFYDDKSENEDGCIFENYKVIRSTEECKNRFAEDNKFILGVGDPYTRRKLCITFEELGGKLIGIISNKSNIGSHNKIDSTSTILQRVVIENDNIIGKGNLIHVGTFISHDVTMGEFCVLSPYSKLLGGCSLGDFCSVGTGAIILPNVHISNNVIIGAGAVVTKDVEPGVTVTGVPARKMDK